MREVAMHLTIPLRRLLLCCALALTFGVVDARGADLEAHLDARDISRNRVHVAFTLAVKPGPLVLVFPKWIPAEHSPSGPLDSIIGLEIRANGSTLPWKRDPIDLFAFAIAVPDGADHLEITLESGLSTGGKLAADTPGNSDQLAVIRWNEFLLLPKGADAATISTAAHVRGPAGWSVASALGSQSPANGEIALEPASLATLIDSPLQVAHYAQVFDIVGSAPRPDLVHHLAVAADSAAALEAPADFAKGYSRLVAEAGALFGSRPYRHYTWLLTLSDNLVSTGEEHHESSDNRYEEPTLSDAQRCKGLAELLAHEYVHSWNGKYRRPEGLLSPDYQKPMDGSLLWVYEGLTQFWGDTLPVRAGLMSPEDERELVASTAGNFDVASGPSWRPVEDTAVMAQRLYDAPDGWSSARRSVDFYEASVFLWLDVDAELRARTKGHASLDDFMRRFYAGSSGGPALKPYAEQDVYDALGALAPADWRALIRRHLDPTGTAAMSAALERSGWKLQYSAEKNTWIDLDEKRHKKTERDWSIGLSLEEDGTIIDTIETRAAARAGAGPGMKLIAVNGRHYSAEVLDAAIAAAQKSHEPIALLLEHDDYFRTMSVPYFDGPRFPHLVRIAASKDSLSEIQKPRVAGRVKSSQADARR